MSFTDRLLVWFHIAFVIFAIGPVTIATMSTPRYIRARNVGVLRYLSRMTRIFGAASVGVLLFGIIAGQSLHDMSKTWVTASLTLFVVALVLLLLIMRDQHKAIAAVEGSLAATPGVNTGEAAPGGPGGRRSPAPERAPTRSPPRRTSSLPRPGTRSAGPPLRGPPLRGPPLRAAPPRVAPPRAVPPRGRTLPRRGSTWPPWSAAGLPRSPVWSASSGWSSWC